MDPFALTTDAVSLISLLAACIVGVNAVRAFQASKRAVIESASLIGVIVDALTSRIQRIESAMVVLRSEIAFVSRAEERSEQAPNALRAAQEATVRQFQKLLTTDKKLIAEIEELRSRIGNLQRIQTETRTPNTTRGPANMAAAIPNADVLAALTPTERQALEILKMEGAKGGPELGGRLQKSREHTSRLMKKLYMEGYVNRDSNHAPFRYRLNDVVRSALQASDDRVKVEPSGTS